MSLTEIAAADGLTVWATEYPLPGPTQGLWSQWGQGAMGGDGHHYSGVGDHLGADGTSYIFEYDPDSREISRIADVLELVDHNPGAWGYGKLHSQMVGDACGSLWLFTYWGTREGLEYGDGYEGDLLLQIDTTERTVRNHGALVSRRGIPSLIGADGGRYLIGEAVDPFSNDGDLVVVDTREAALLGTIDDPDHIGFRALASQPPNRVLYSTRHGEARAIEPSTMTSGPSGFEWPSDDGDFLRAATYPDVKGTVYAVMNEAQTIFSLSATGAIEELAPSGGYTTSLATTPQGDRVYWLPRAHGDAWQEGAVVRRLDTSTGEVTEVVALQQPFEEAFGLLPGGTYSAVYDNGRLFLGINASPVGNDSGFGRVVFVAIEGL